MKTPITLLPTTPPSTAPRPTKPYRRLEASGVTLSFRKAKNVATISVLKRSPKR
jgi:hypothetical protein